MINAISPIQYQTYNIPNNNAGMQPYMIPQSIPSNMQGLNAYGVYNAPMIQPSLNLTPALPTIMLPEGLPALKGERVLNSDGKLHSIIERTPEYTNITEMTPSNDKVISKITARDNVTGFIIREQSNLIKPDGTIGGISINEYYPKSNKLKRYTVYDGGKPDYVVEYEYPTNDITIRKSHECAGGNYAINEYNKATGKLKTTVFDENKVLKYIANCNLDGTGETVYYTNGVPSKIEPRKINVPMKNITGKNPFEDKDLLPHAKISLNYNPLNLQGEKTFYSNGVVETLKVKGSDKDCEYYYKPDSRLAAMTEKYPDGTSMFVDFDDFGQTIMEKYNDSKSRITSWEQDGTYNVSYIENDLYKNLGTAVNENEYYYKEQNKSDDSSLFMVYNKNRDLIRVEDSKNRNLS